jgi:uncharacterized 2Fe-2S/4Fe-4S cluster protein (DUF4445 family)
MPRLYLWPNRRELTFRPGQNLYEVLVAAGINPGGQVCGGQGICGKCRVRLQSTAPPPNKLDRKQLTDVELAGNIRLACGLIPKGEEVVELFIARPSLAAKAEIGTEPFTVDPWPHLAANDLVLAVDLGTTNLVAHLIDPGPGRVIGSSVAPNSQAIFGADVVSRLTYASRGGPKARKKLSDLAWDDIESLAETILPPASRIRHAVMVMNSAMETLLLELDPDLLGRAPYKPEITGPVHRKSTSEGVLAGTEIHLPPLIGGYVGSDALSALLTVLSTNPALPFLLLDIGTNSEVILADQDGFVACSTAAGPAFEGSGISCGIQAVERAITQMRLAENHWVYSIIGDGQPLGLTGSGLFSMLGELIRTNGVDHFGVFVPDNLPPDSLETGANGRRLALAPGVHLSEADIQQLMLAKAATRAGVETLLELTNQPAEKLAGIYLCGNFAGHLDPADVLSIGLLPQVKMTKLIFMKNAAAVGAAMMAASREKFNQAVELAGKIVHLPLSGHPQFKVHFEEQVCFCA